MASALTFKVGAKGGVSVYGLGRFPVTLYASQWDALIAALPDLQRFLDAHRSELAMRQSPSSEYARQTRMDSIARRVYDHDRDF